MSIANSIVARDLIVDYTSETGTVRRPPPMLVEHTALVRERGWAAFSA